MKPVGASRPASFVSWFRRFLAGREHGPGRAERQEEGAPGVRGIGVKAPRHKRLHRNVPDCRADRAVEVEPANVA